MTVRQALRLVDSQVATTGAIIAPTLQPREGGEQMTKRNVQGVQNEDKRGALDEQAEERVEQAISGNPRKEPRQRRMDVCGLASLG
jgi:hypothetical protein